MLESILLYIKQGLNAHLRAFSPIIIIEDHIYRLLFTHSSYMLEQIPFIFQTNNDLYLSTQKLTFEFDNIFNVNVTELSVENTIKKIMECINQLHKL